MSSLTVNTSPKKINNVIRRMEGKGGELQVKYINDQGLIHKHEIANMLAKTFERNSSVKNYHPKNLGGARKE